MEPNPLSPRTGLILAGGLGTRLHSVLPDTAKAIAPIQGRPFLTFLLEQFRRAAVERIILCTGHRAEQVRLEIGEEFKGIPITYSVEDQPLGTGGALGRAYRNWGGGETWFVLNGDSFLGIDLNQLQAEHERGGQAATIAAVAVADARRFGALEWSATGQVTAFHEKSGTPGEKWINGGVYLFGPEFLKALSETVPLSLEREVFPAWIPRGIHVFPQPARFIDIGTPADYFRAQEFFQ